MRLSPDELVVCSLYGVEITATVVNTWGIMGVVTLFSWFVTRNFQIEGTPPKSQQVAEVIVEGIVATINDAAGTCSDRYLPFIGTLFLFILFSNVAGIFPGFEPPTASLSTASALAFCVFLAVPFYGISKNGLGGYLKNYLYPTPLMLPFNIFGELSRTLALAVRLFGNIMSGGLIIAIMLSLAPLLFPVLMQLLGLLTGVIQAYIFAILAVVYIASASSGQD